jgi:Na+/glutamate symporter
MENAKDSSRNHAADTTAPANNPVRKTEKRTGKRTEQRTEQRTENRSNDSGGNLRRAAAIIAIALLAGLYLVTFVLAVAGNEKSAGMLRFCFGMTIFVPLFIWVMIWCVGYLRHKKSMASLNILDSNPKERERMEEAIARGIGREDGKQEHRPHGES